VAFFVACGLALAIFAGLRFEPLCFGPRKATGDYIRNPVKMISKYYIALLLRGLIAGR
jgi:hypothetical protein